MTEREFCYWLQGKLEDRDLNTVTPTEVASIRNHLDLVFTKVTPELNEGLETPMPLDKIMNEWTKYEFPNLGKNECRTTTPDEVIC